MWIGVLLGLSGSLIGCFRGVGWNVLKGRVMWILNDMVVRLDGYVATARISRAHGKLVLCALRLLLERQGCVHVRIHRTSYHRPSKNHIITDSSTVLYALLNPSPASQTQTPLLPSPS